jgi:hypothetical protein
MAKDYTDGLTNNQLGIILEDVYKGQVAKVLVPTLSPSQDKTSVILKKANKPSCTNIVSDVDLGLQAYMKCNYIPLRANQKYYKGDKVTVSTVDDYTVEDMSIVGKYNE